MVSLPWLKNTDHAVCQSSCATVSYLKAILVVQHYFLMADNSIQPVAWPEHGGAFIARTPASDMILQELSRATQILVYYNL